MLMTLVFQLLTRPRTELREQHPAAAVGAPAAIAARTSVTPDCEVLVVGAGSSGTFAAAEAGAKTILIEKFGHDMAGGIQIGGEFNPRQVAAISIDGKFLNSMHRADLYRFGGKRGIIFCRSRRRKRAELRKI